MALRTNKAIKRKETAMSTYQSVDGHTGEGNTRADNVVSVRHNPACSTIQTVLSHGMLFRVDMWNVKSLRISTMDHPDAQPLNAHTIPTM